MDTQAVDQQTNKIAAIIMRLTGPIIMRRWSCFCTMGVGEMIQELGEFTDMCLGVSVPGESSELSTAANRAWQCQKTKGSNPSGMKVWFTS